jgi:hypothetical protein
MPKLNKFKIYIETGSNGIEEPVRFCFNSHVLPLEDLSGGTKPGETLEGGYDINSVAHSMTLVGPEKGTWSVKKIKVDFEVENTPSYSVEYSAVELDETTELNIWKDPPLETFDV